MSDGQNARTEVVPEVIFLGRLVERIVAGKIRIPKFQRPFVWKQADLYALLDSVLQGFPIGSILVWDTEDEVKTTESVGPVAVSPHPGGLVGYLLDGQQRVSTLVGTLRLPDGAGSIVHDVDWRVYCDLDKREFLRQPTDGVKPHHFPVGSLLNTAGFFTACRRIESEVGDESMAQKWLDEADRLASAFRDYQLPLVHIREATLDSAITVFARLNRTGRKITADQMVSALTHQEGQFNLADKLSDFFEEELDGRGFGNLDRVFLLRAILAALGHDIYAKEWANLVVKPEVGARLPEAFNSATEGIKAALDFLQNLGVTSDRLLPYGLQLVLLGEFFRMCPQPDDNVVALLERWFWVTSFTGWFGGVNSTQATRALGEIRALAKDKNTGLSVVDLDAPAQAFPERFDGRSARVRAFLLYLASLHPRSPRDRKCLDPGRLLSNRGTRAVGYVSSKPEGLEGLFSNPANRMFLDAEQVGQAFTDLTSLEDDMLRELLPTHGFPENSIHLLRNDDRLGLIRLRLEALIAGEREFMEERHVNLPTTQTATNIADSETSDEE